MLFIAPPASAASIGSGSCISTANSDANVFVSSGSGYCYVAFKGTGTNSWTAPAGTTSADFLIVAGGGSGGSGAWGGGGGAGGVNGKLIPGCKKRAVLENANVACSYRPSTRGYVVITATLYPTITSYIGTTTTTSRYFVGNRTGKRAG